MRRFRNAASVLPAQSVRSSYVSAPAELQTGQLRLFPDEPTIGPELRFFVEWVFAWRVAPFGFFIEGLHE